MKALILIIFFISLSSFSSEEKLCTTLCDKEFLKFATVETVQELIDEGHDVNALNEFGESPLMILLKDANWVVFNNDPKDNYKNPLLKEVFHFLIEKGADPNHTVNDFTLLHYACKGDNSVDIIQELVEVHGVDIDAKVRGDERFKFVVGEGIKKNGYLYHGAVDFLYVYRSDTTEVENYFNQKGITRSKPDIKCTYGINEGKYTGISCYWRKRPAKKNYFKIYRRHHTNR